MNESSVEETIEEFLLKITISLLPPRKDICTYCAKNNTELNEAKLKEDDALIKKFTTSKILHLRHAQVCFDLLKSKKKNPDNSELIICFDFEKKLLLPVTNISDEYYKRQLWLHNLGINNVLSNQATMLLLTENFAHKGPNEVLTALEYYINMHKKPDSHTLKIFCDNCFPQIKNRFMFTYLGFSCLANIFEEIVIYYPIPEHSMIPIDRCFAAIEKRRKKEKIDNPHSYIKKREFYKLFDEESSEVDNKIEDDDNSETEDFE
ncbi:hypothetical protein ILUMI_18192 [Ignelater luminosus]|uniref:DUF7869 domain-containing protein n=1 Tax=Ignelater luminosus TaxID=2038154 RepID=A0A8K0CN18_IGNLU|nr:hypothetical protein ILUMI_18192 [Ignelater luminosus]